METLKHFLSGPIATTLGWTLLHATWQILLFSLVYFLVNLFTKNATIRYRTGLAVMTLQFTVSIGTFLWLRQISGTSDPGLNFSTQTLTVSFFAKTMVYFKQNLPLIVGLWSLGFLGLLLKMLTGYFWMVNLKNSSKLVTNKNLNELIENLKVKMGVARQINLKTSLNIDVPLMLGYFKPVVLLPVSLISGFSMKQIEIILAHELAHIKRNDYLINLLQSFLDIVFFYHPVFWIVSAQIRKEREICTDELALQYTGDKIMLANILLQLQETRITPGLALAFGKKQTAFSERIHRILGLKTSRSFPKESLWILVGLLITFFAFAQNKQTKKPMKITESTSVAMPDTLLPSENSISINSENNNFSIKNKKLYFNNKEIQLSPEKSAIVNQHLEALEQQKHQMDQQSKLMEEQSKQMEQQSEKMSDWSTKLNEQLKPLQTYSQEINTLSNEISKKSAEFTKKTSKLNVDSKEFTKIQNIYDLEVEKLSAQIDAISKKMDEVTNNSDLNNKEMEELSLEMDRRSAEMDKLAEPMDRIGEEMDNTIRSIVDLLPNEIKSKINVEFKDAPKPPKPPKKPKHGKSAIAPPPPPPPLIQRPEGKLPPPPVPPKNN